MGRYVAGWPARGPSTNAWRPAGASLHEGVHMRRRPALTAASVSALVLAGAVVPLAGTTTARAAERTATLVGSLQSELGCPGDWQPDCTDTDLVRQDGTSTYAAEFDVPAGSYELKVAIDHGWGESYGQDGGGSNVPLVLKGPERLRVTYDDTSHSIGITPTDLPGAATKADAALAGQSLRTGSTRERFYFVMADRFANADTANDRGGLTGDPLATGYDPTNMGFYHGGDLKGVIGKLDYIKGLGTTAIWLTPSFKNRPVQGSGANASAGYHGYWVTDFTQIDPHLGTNADMKELIGKAHKRGIKVFFDIITNHTADVISSESGYVTKAAQPYKDKNGNAFDDLAFVSGETFPELDPAVSFPYVPVIAPADAQVKQPAWLN